MFIYQILLAHAKHIPKSSNGSARPYTKDVLIAARTRCMFFSFWDSGKFQSVSLLFVIYSRCSGDGKTGGILIYWTSNQCFWIERRTWVLCWRSQRKKRSISHPTPWAFFYPSTWPIFHSRVFLDKSVSENLKRKLWVRGKLCEKITKFLTVDLTRKGLADPENLTCHREQVRWIMDHGTATYSLYILTNVPVSRLSSQQMTRTADLCHGHTSRQLSIQAI